VNFHHVLEQLGKCGYEGNLFLELYIDRLETHAETIAYEEDCVRQSVEFAHNELKLF